MENNTPVEGSSGQEDNSSAIFGTSSDAIIQGLHKGAFADQENVPGKLTPGDNLIVNEQEQNEIVNPDEEEFTEKTFEESPATTNTIKENQGISDEVIEGDTVDDGIENDEETL